MHRFIGFVMLVLALFASPAFATAPAKTEAQVKLELLHSLEQDGYLSAKLAAEAKVKYVDPAQLASPVTATSAQAAAPGPTLWERYINWANALKVVAVGLLLIAFGGTIRNIIKGVWHLLVLVPVEVYQVPMLGASIFATVMPESMWLSQALYIALAASIANIILGIWILVTHKRLEKLFARLLNWGIPVSSVLSFWGMLYFGALALHHQSQVFGFFATVCLSGVFTFGLYYTWGTLWLHFQEKALSAVVFGHLLVLGACAALHATNHLPAGAQYFTGGLQYYCSVALGIGLLCGASPWNRKNCGLYVLTFILTVAAASIGYFMFDLTGIGSVIFCFSVLFVLEWLMYLGYKGGVIAGCAVTGAALYGAAMLVQHYGHYIILSLA